MSTAPGRASDELRRAVILAVTAICRSKMAGAVFAYDHVKLQCNCIALGVIQVDLQQKCSNVGWTALILHIAKEIVVAGTPVHAVRGCAMSIAIIVLLAGRIEKIPVFGLGFIQHCGPFGNRATQ